MNVILGTFVWAIAWKEGHEQPLLHKDQGHLFHASALGDC